MTEIVQRTPQQALMDRLEGENVQKALVALLPENVTPERFRRVFGTALMANPDIAEAETNSVIRSLLRIAEMGLLPDGKQAAIVTYYSKKKQANIAQGLAMIEGVRIRFQDHGWTLRTQVVYANEEFSFALAPVEWVARHERVRPGAERGDLVYAYARASHRDGRVEFKIVDRTEVEKSRSVSRATGPGTPWVEWESRMWEKTAGHALARQIGLAESDRMVAMFAPPPENGYEAAKEFYGPSGTAALAPGETVDRSTGEISSGPDGSTDGGASGGTATQQAEAAVQSAEEGSSPPSTSPPSAASAPEPDDDPEPGAEAVVDEAVAKAGAVIVPSGANKGKALAELLETEAGTKWVEWAARNPTASSVGPTVHAAVQHLQPDLFQGS